MADHAALLNQAIQLKINGQYDEAIAILKSVLQDDPADTSARHQLGLIYVFTGLYDESITELKAAVTLSPDHITYLIDLAKTLTMLGEDDQAKPVFQKVLSLDPFNEEAEKNLQFLS